MQYHSINAAKHLDPFVRQLWLYQGCSKRPLPTLLPGTGTELLINLADPIQLQLGTHSRTLGHDALICCPRTAQLKLTATGNVKLLSIRFRSSGFYQLFRVPMHGLTDQLHLYSDVFNATDLSWLFDEHSDVERLSRLQRWLSDKLEQSNDHNLLFGQVIEQVYYGLDKQVLSRVKSEAACSERSFQRKFKTFTGVDAKYFSRTARFQACLKQLLHTDRMRFAELSTEQSFYDQSHFIKEFRHFSGQTPKDYLARHNHPYNYYRLTQNQNQ